MRDIVEEFGGIVLGVLGLTMLMAILTGLGIGSESGMARFIMLWGTGGVR